MTARSRIIKAAFELISSKGYQGATTREIALSAGVAEVTIFRHFTNKETLFAEVLHSYSTIPTLAELLPKLGMMDYEAGVRMLTFRFVARLEELRDWLRILNAEVGYAPDILQDQYNAFMNQIFMLLTEYFEDIHNRGFLRPDLEPLYAARTFHSMVMGFFYVEGFLGVKSRSADSYASLMDVFVDIFCRGTNAQASQFEAVAMKPE